MATKIKIKVLIVANPMEGRKYAMLKKSKVFYKILSKRVISKTFFKYFTSYMLLTITILFLILFFINMYITNKIESELILQKEKVLNIYKEKMEDIVIVPLNGTALSYVVDAAANPDSDIYKIMKRGYLNNLYNVWRLSRRLKSEKDHNPVIDSIDIYFHNNKFIVSSDGFYKTVDSYARNDVIDVYTRNQNTVIDGNWFIIRSYGVNDDFEDVYSFIKTIPYATSNNEKIGFVCINVEKETLLNIAKNMNFGQEESLIILSKYDDAILTYNDEANKENILSILENTERLNSEWLKSISSSKNKLFYSVSQVNDWRYILISPWKEISQISIQMKNNMLVVIAAISILGVILSWILSKNLYRPIGKLLKSLSPNGTEPGDEFIYINNQINQLKKRSFQLSEEMEKNA